MIGTSAQNGKQLEGIDHLRQSVRDILTTPLGTRVMRREYGSRLYQLVDAPLNRATIVELYAATIEALERWEPRIKVSQVSLARATAGGVSLSITGTYLPDGREITLDGIEVR
ncbi:GPW/gp25 family protein (plasmid) [Roseomonas marmotae]|uniref:GPW/gp25 family protein n=1 Tax=Roseomonas marmotae TaxID=2768161 RepID=UPI001AD67006|nr:GPW/gp25 family protein [Roseomonas marmotae]QTI81496.1 GPW/gp25 family protein [Roseomonas marmotae]